MEGRGGGGRGGEGREGKGRGGEGRGGEGNLSYFFVRLFVILCAVRSFWKIRGRI